MKKKLMLDALEIESFATNHDAPAEPRGTVRGNAATLFVSTCVRTCTFSCGFTCGDTCYVSCNGVTCGIGCQ